MDKKRDAPQKEKRSSYQWTRDLTTQLIVLYQQHPCLYAPKHKDYRSESHRRTALETIAVTLNMSTLHNFTVEDVQRKIHGVRTQYVREISLMRKGAIEGRTYTPRLWCFELMDFLRGVCTQSVVKEEESGLLLGDECKELYDNSMGDVEADDHVFSPSSERGSLLSVEEHPKKKGKESGNASNHSNVIFGKMLASEMENVWDEEVLDDLKEEIMGALFKAKRKCREKRNLLNDL